MDPCTGQLTCTPRGRCQETAYDQDPAPVANATAEVTVDHDALQVDASASTATLTLGGPMEREVRFRVATDVAWLVPQESRGSFTGTHPILFSVNRDGLAPGAYTGNILIATSEGQKTVTVTLSQSLVGVYVGSVTYQSPRAFGTTPIRIEITVDNGVYSFHVLRQHSPLFPLVGGKEATGTGSMQGGQVVGTIVQRVAPFDLGGQHVVDRDLGREFSFSLTPSSDGGLAGTFSERWSALFAAPVTATGAVALRRLPGVAPSTFTVPVPDSLPGSPSINPPAITTACTTAVGGACVAGAATPDLLTCGDSSRTNGAGIEGQNGLVVQAGSTRGYVAMTAACQNDLDAANASTPAASPTPCVRPGSLSCALGYYGRAWKNGNDVGAGLAGVDRVVANDVGVGLLLLNDALVQAFRAPYQGDGTTASMEQASLAAIGAGRSRARARLRDVLDPFTLDALSHVNASGGGASFVGLRRAALLLSRDALAIDEMTTIQVRSTSTSRDAVRDALSQETVNLLVSLIALGRVQQLQGASSTAEVAALDGLLTSLGNRFVELSTVVDPLGVPEGFVEFQYDCSQRTNCPQSNYAHVLESAQVLLSDAVATEGTADSAIRTYDESLSSLQSQLTSIHASTIAEISRTCGSYQSPVGDLTWCIGGDAAVATADIEEARAAVLAANRRVQGAQERIDAQTQRMKQVLGLLEENIVFYTRQGQKIAVLREYIGEISAVQAALSVPIGPLGEGIGRAVAMGYMEYAKQELERQVERLDELRQIHAMTTNLNIEQANAMAVLKDLAIAKAELMSEAGVAAQRLLVAIARREALLNNVRVAVANEALLQASATGSLANDPTFRVLRDVSVANATASRERALRQIYLAAKAFEYETNVPIPWIRSQLVPVRRASQIQRFLACLQDAQNAFVRAYGPVTTFSVEFSLRHDILGIEGDVLDEVSGETLTPAQQFQRLLVTPSNVASTGVVGLPFTTSIASDNAVFSYDLCNEFITGVSVRLVGDGLGDDQAEVRITHGGSSQVRSCESFRNGNDEILDTYTLLPRRVVMPATVNVSSPALDTQLFQRSVAATNWRLEINPHSGANRDINVTKIEDIVVRVAYQGHSVGATTIGYAPVCPGL
ncbi:MAG: hypothetical protein U0230_25030 [Polyangiales bacterium]